MTPEPSLYERVWNEPPPKGRELHGRRVQHQDSLSQLVDQLETWDSQEPLMANQTAEKMLVALQAVEARVAHLQKIGEAGPSRPDLQDTIQKLSNLVSELTNQLNMMHAAIERRLESHQEDIAKRIDDWEASMRRRDLTFIESLVTVAELSWVGPDQRLLAPSFETYAPTPSPSD